jgi:hypothetical protein
MKPGFILVYSLWRKIQTDHRFEKSDLELKAVSIATKADSVSRFRPSFKALTLFCNPCLIVSGIKAVSGLKAGR